MICCCSPVKLFQNFPEILTRYQLQFRYFDWRVPGHQMRSVLTCQTLSQPLQKYLCRWRRFAIDLRLRGADFRNIVNFQKDYPNAKVFNLEQNYRSTQNILDAAYSVISKNHSHPILKLWPRTIAGPESKSLRPRNETEEAMFIIQTIKQFSTFLYPQFLCRPLPHQCPIPGSGRSFPEIRYSFMSW